VIERAGLIREIRIEPRADAWGPAIARSWERSKHDVARLAVRGRLGLPTDRPTLMTGHQPGFWHGGILSKYVAVDAACERFGCAAGWIVADQDDVDPGLIPAPTENGDGRLTRASFRVLPAPPAGAAIASVRAASPIAPDASVALPPVRRGIDRAIAACRAHEAAGSLGEQAALAARDALLGVVRPAPISFASRLFLDDVVWGFVREMVEDAAGAVSAYNRAASRFPGGGVAALSVRGAHVELPLWRLCPGGARERVWSDSVGDVPRAELAPRALLMTAILRRFACDLFVHGTGGWEYDRVSEAWMREWRGLELAPMALVTGSVLLDLGRGAGVSRGDAARAVWRAHHARHDPGMLGRQGLADEKLALVRAIAEARARGEAPGPTYERLTSMLRAYRAGSAEELARLDREAAEALARVSEGDILRDRTWPFVLHTPETLRALRAQMRAEFGVES